MVAACLRQREGLGVAYVRVADDRQVIPKRLERTQAARGEVETHCLRPPAPTGSFLSRIWCCRPNRGPFRCTPGEPGSAVGLPNALRAGTMASSNGSDTAAPMPRSIVRREICLLVMYILFRPSGAGSYSKADPILPPPWSVRCFPTSSSGNAALFTMPKMKEDMRLPLCAASRAIARTAGMS